MDTKTKITELYADAKICTVMRGYLQANKLVNLCNINEVSAKSDIIILRHNTHEKTYNCPVRLGEILDRLIFYNNMNSCSLIYFNGCALDTHQGIFTNELEEQIYLTEKETAILSLLHANKGEIISRAKLLKSVWNYTKDIDTHTLETHIYRLRQKIERNPANPQILITKEDGYSLS